jgi:hypothetical protein
MRRDVWAMQRVRRIVSFEDGAERVARMGDDEVLARAAALAKRLPVLAALFRGGAAAPAVEAPQAHAAPAESSAPAESAPPAPEKPIESKPKKTWIEIRLVGLDGGGLTGEAYKVQLPDGSTREGQLDTDGKARIDDIDPGGCTVSFPDLTEEDWKPAP